MDNVDRWLAVIRPDTLFPTMKQYGGQKVSGKSNNPLFINLIINLNDTIIHIKCRLKGKIINWINIKIFYRHLKG